MPLVLAITKDFPGTADLRRGALPHEKTERAVQFLLCPRPVGNPDVRYRPTRRHKRRWSFTPWTPGMFSAATRSAFRSASDCTRPQKWTTP